MWEPEPWPRDATPASGRASASATRGAELRREPEIEFTDPTRHPVHNIYRFPAKIHPPAAKYLVARYSRAGETITDPFGGSGTIALEAKLGGRRSVSHDVDPLAVLITRCKTTHLPAATANRLADVIDSAIGPLIPRDEDRVESTLSSASADTVGELRAAGHWLPKHPNLTHWYSDVALRDLATLGHALRNLQPPRSTRRLISLAFAKIVRAASNADPVPASGLEVTTHYRKKVERKPRVNNPARLFRDTILKFARLLAEVPRVGTVHDHTATLRNAAAPYRGTVRPCDVVITSPPYGVAVDYARRHSLEHYWLSFIGDPIDKVRLGKKYIGRAARRGGSDAPVGMRGPVASAIVRNMRHDPQAVRAFDQFCGAMRHALHNAARGLPRGGLAVFVVGRSVWAGVPIAADQLIAELGAERFSPDHLFTYPVKNRHMSYARRNGANIDREIVLALRKKG